MFAAIKRLIGNFGATELGGQPNVGVAEEGDTGGKAQTVEPAMETLQNVPNLARSHSSL